jgi:alginate O-acetyltransferase complex protein AlgI
MFITSVMDFSMGRIITRPGATPRARNWALAASCIVDLSLLGFLKYYMFFMGGINRAAELFGYGTNLFFVYNITLPIGISFYTFQSLSYTIDVWRGDAPPVKDFPTYTCFVALFPQLIAGPIVRYNTVAEQLSYRTHTLEMFTKGVALFMLGFTKKILLANAAGEVADAAFASDSLGAAAAWWGILGYHFQIYFDFCAYSDMAVGLGRMMGFEFIKNFDSPYQSRSMTEFWRRWHISLSTWIRDNLYISLGGNRKGKGRTYFNLVVSMFLCGMWHGAKMTFVTWGVMHGAFLIWERLMGKKSLYSKMPPVLAMVITNVIVLLLWVPFRSPDIGQATHYWTAMLGLARPLASVELLHAQIFNTRHVFEMLLCGVLVWQPIQAHLWVEKLTPVRLLVVALVFTIAIIGMFTQSFNPFLYFQF